MFDKFFHWWQKNGFIFLLVSSIFFILSLSIFNKKTPIKSTSWKSFLNNYLSLDLAKEQKKRNPKKTEEKCREIVERIFSRPFPSMRPDFLKNPETGRNMECDLMNPELKLCIERNGEQHYKHTKYFHTHEQFQKQLQRDELKKQLLQKNGYNLITIPYTVHYDSLEEYIPQQIRKFPEYQKYLG